MGKETRLSAKGQVVIPKDVREQLGIEPGDPLEVHAAKGGVFLRKRSDKERLPIDQVFAELRRIVSYEGRPATVEDMSRAVDAMFTEKAPL